MDMESFLAPGSENRHLEKNQQINGLRSLLCLLVLAYHFGALYWVRFGGLKKLPTLYPNLVIMVVGMFFLIAGFFLSFRNPWDYLKNKFFHIYLPFALTVFVVFFVCYYSQYPGYITYSQWGLNFLLYPLAMNQTKYAAGNLWFIVYLWTFFTVYWLFNLLALPFKKKINIVPLLMLVYMVLCFSYNYIVWTEKTASYGHLLANLFFLGHYRSYAFLFIGYFLRLAYDALKKEEKGYALGAFLSALLGFSFLMVELYGLDHYHWASAVLFLSLLALFILALWNKLPFFQREPFQKVGDASMWIYLIHENIGYLIINAFYSNGQNDVAYGVGLFWALSYAFIMGLLLEKGQQKILRCLKKKTPAKTPSIA